MVTVDMDTEGEVRMADQLETADVAMQLRTALRQEVIYGPNHRIGQEAARVEDLLMIVAPFVAAAFDAGCWTGGGESTANWDFDSWWGGEPKFEEVKDRAWRIAPNWLTRAQVEKTEE